MHTARRSIATLLAALLLLAGVGFAPPAEAATTTWWVDIATGDNANAGTDVAPLRTIDAAMVHASSGDTIMVRPGLYGAEAEQSFPIIFKPGVNLTSTDGADVTTIRGDGTNNVIRFINATTHTTVSGFTITDVGSSGQSGITVTRGVGAGTSSWPVIEKCVIDACGNISSTGGGMYVEGASGWPASPTIRDTAFRDNIADEGGGAYFGTYTDAWLFGVTFEGNAAYRGGGLCTRTQVGLHVIGSSFTGNLADGGLGGGLDAEDGGGELYIASTELVGNAAQTGGGLYASTYNGIYESLSIVGNSASKGGGMSHRAGFPTLTNCLIAGNDAEYGGASWNRESTLYIYYSTIADNTSTFWAGLYADIDNGGHIEIEDSVVWGHGGADIHGASIVNYTDTQDTNLADNANTGVTNVIHADPLFWDAPADYRLSPGSPCVDAADPSFTISEDAFGTERPADGDGNGTGEPDMGYYEYVVAAVERLAGDDRYETAAEAVLSSWVAVDYAIIASGENFPDALSAAGLAGAYFCPLLLVRKDSVPQATADALASLGVKEIIIVGGTAAVSDAVMDELGEAYDTGRIWGDDRYETAANVADEITRRVGPTFAGSAFVARGDAFPDALAVSPLAYRASMYGGGMPILLTRPGDLPASTADAIDALGISAAYVIGGEGAVSSATKTALDALLVANGGTASERLYGDDRYATAVAVAEAGPDHDWGWWQNVGIATGANFPDALAGGPVMGMQNGVLLLTAPTALSPATATALGTHVPDIQSVTVFGGPSAVSETVLGLISAALQP